jgi:hypothetical protein
MEATLQHSYLSLMMLPRVVDFKSSHKNITMPRSLLKMYFFTVLKSRSPKLRHREGHAASEAYKRNLFLASSNFWCLSLVVHWVMAALLKSLSPTSHGILPVL